MSDQDILKIAKEYNVGDLALNNNPNQTRNTIGNRQYLKGNIFPMELVNKSQPDRNFNFIWCPFGDDDFFADAKDDGYKVVVEGEWICTRPGWDWETPERDKFKWSESRLLVHRNRFAMYRDEEAFVEARRRRAEDKESQIRARHEESIAVGEKHGVEVEATIAGKTERGRVSRGKSVS